MKFCFSQPKPYYRNQKTGEKLFNEFLEQSEKEIAGSGLSLDFLKGENGRRLDSFFTDKCMLGMLEGKEYDKIIMILPIYGEIDDVCCDSSKIASVTRVFTKYAELLQTTRENTIVLAGQKLHFHYKSSRPLFFL